MASSRDNNKPPCLSDQQDESFDKNSKLENNFLGYQWVTKKVGGLGKLEKLGVF